VAVEAFEFIADILNDIEVGSERSAKSYYMSDHLISRIK
jgi:hypothetical protein